MCQIQLMFLTPSSLSFLQTYFVCRMLPIALSALFLVGFPLVRGLDIFLLQKKKTSNYKCATHTLHMLRKLWRYIFISKHFKLLMCNSHFTCAQKTLAIYFYFKTLQIINVQFTLYMCSENSGDIFLFQNTSNY